MSLGQLLFSFQGRINRKPWWLTSLAMGGIMLVLIIAVIVMLGASIDTLQSGDPMKIMGALGGAFIVFLIVLIPMIWVGLAIGAKRLHDRNKSAWWLALFYLLPIVLDSIAGRMGDVGFVLSLAGFAVSIWGLVELGFLRGTVGPNQYGPDPLEGRI